MYLNASNGVRNVDRRVVEAARSFGLRGWRLVRKVIIPLALPSILTGLRFAAGISIVALVFAETIGEPGHRLPRQSGQQPPAGPHPGGVHHHLRLLGITADVCVRIIERYAMPGAANGRPMTGTTVGAPAAVLRDVTKTSAGATSSADLDLTVAGASSSPSSAPRAAGRRPCCASPGAGGGPRRRGVRARGPHHRLPGAPPGRLHEGVAQRGHRTATPGAPGRGRRRAPGGRAGEGTPTPGPAPSRVARPSGSPSHGRSSASPSCSYSTSRSPRSTPSPGSSMQALVAELCTATSRGCSWSPTTSRRPSCWPTVFVLKEGRISLNRDGRPAPSPPGGRGGVRRAARPLLASSASSPANAGAHCGQSARRPVVAISGAVASLRRVVTLLALSLS